MSEKSSSLISVVVVVLVRKDSQATLAASCSASFLCKNTFGEVNRSSPTNAVALNLGKCADPSLTVVKVAAGNDAFWRCSFNRALYIKHADISRHNELIHVYQFILHIVKRNEKIANNTILGQEVV